MPDTSRRWLAGNALWLQAGWWGCVLGAQRPWLLLAVVIGLVVHVLFCQRRGTEIGVLLRVGLAGCLLDAGLGALGLFAFDQTPLPPWLALLWLVLSSGMRHSLGWMRRPLWRGAVIGLVGGPLAYLAGAPLAGVGLPWGALPTALVLAVVWAVWLLVCLRLATSTP